jgi:hypothetical protein
MEFSFFLVYFADFHIYLTTLILANPPSSLIQRTRMLVRQTEYNETEFHKPQHKESFPFTVIPEGSAS